MPYVPPYIDNTGMHIPTYNEIRDDLIQQMKSIFGDDIYIDVDSKDYQQISIFAKKIFDTNALGLLVYNNRTANTAIGVGLDNICALVGIKRKPATYSTVQLTVTGDSGTVITNGKATDGTYTWNLPKSVTIPENGTIVVEATCNVSGSITAAANTINTIVTPVFGWFSVTNTYTASPGTNQETDAELRARYANATYQPTKTVLEGLIENIESLEGVSRVRLYENDTNVADSNALPPHSITAVVEGGIDDDIATAIYFKKTPGCYTNGTTAVELTTLSGAKATIRFYRPTYKPVYVKVTIKQLAGYNHNYAEDIKLAIANYIQEMQIAEPVYRSILWSVAVQTMTSINTPAFSVLGIQLSTDGATYQDADIDMLFNEVAQTSSANVVVEVS
jgi:uncharacterized phage protein gp47/JayE